MPRLDSWAMFITPDNEAYLKGIVLGSPAFQDGKHVKTSHIENLDLDAMTAITHKGTLYHLGRPDAGWIEWLKKSPYRGQGITSKILAIAEAMGEPN